MNKHRDTRPSFEAAVHLEPSAARVVVRGEIDIATAERFEQRVLEAIDAGGPVVIDLSGTSFLDSTGLSAIVRLVGRLDASGGSEGSPLVIEAPTVPVAKTLQISGIDRLVSIRDAPTGG